MCGKVDVLLLDVPPSSTYPLNVFGVVGDTVLWQLESTPDTSIQHPTSVYIDVQSTPDGLVRLMNYNGLHVVIDPKNGLVVRKEFSK